MSSLQKTGKLEDGGFEKLNNKITAETDYLKKYQSGDVETKKNVFEQGSTSIKKITYSFIFLLESWTVR